MVTVWISKNEIVALSDSIRRIIDGQDVDIRNNREGAWGFLLNDIHTLASLKNEQVEILSSERDSMKDTIANISHQIKTPLTSMLIMAELLEKENNNPNQVEFISNIKIGLTRLEWLSTALLKMAKLDSNTVDFSRKPILSSELIDLSLIPLQILLELKSQTVNVTGEVTLNCDKQWTAEALTNIIKNASEHSPNNSSIAIEVGENPICSWVSVTDNGNGIANRDVAKLFRRFEGSRTAQGYGIGLPLALGIMRGQGGDIEVDGGGNGSGATFTVKFYG